MDRVAREVSEAFAQVRSRKQQITVAQTGIKAARKSYTANQERIRQGVGLPIEVLQSIQALDQAQRELLRAVTGYKSGKDDGQVDRKDIIYNKKNHAKLSNA